MWTLTIKKNKELNKREKRKKERETKRKREREAYWSKNLWPKCWIHGTF
jgi:hypothetical protein